MPEEEPTNISDFHEEARRLHPERYPLLPQEPPSTPDPNNFARPSGASRRGYYRHLVLGIVSETISLVQNGLTKAKELLRRSPPHQT